MKQLTFIEEALAERERAGLLRRRGDPGRVLPSREFSTNDYLGLAEGDDVGAGASRLVRDHGAHQALETAIAHWLGYEAGLLFSSGYAAHAGSLPALIQPGDLVVSDQFNHASLIDGLRLSRGEIRVVPHLDLEAVRHTLRTRSTRRAWVVTESYFSMDADGPDLRALHAIVEEGEGILYLDEAHALGVFGVEGGGLAAAAGVKPHVSVVTLGKALGAQGAVVLSSAPAIDWLWNMARSLVYSTGISPHVADVTRARVRRVAEATRAREALHAGAKRFRAALAAFGYPVLGHGPIVPWVLGTTERTLRVAAKLRAEGYGVAAIRPPTVPEGGSRIRFTLSSRHTEEDIDNLIRTLEALGP